MPTKPNRLRSSGGPGLPDVHGVIAVPELGRVYATATNSHQIAVIDTTSLAIVATAQGDGYPDGPCLRARSWQVHMFRTSRTATRRSSTSNQTSASAQSRWAAKLATPSMAEFAWKRGLSRAPASGKHHKRQANAHIYAPPLHAIGPSGVSVELGMAQPGRVFEKKFDRYLSYLSRPAANVCWRRRRLHMHWQDRVMMICQGWVAVPITVIS